MNKTSEGQRERGLIPRSASHLCPCGMVQDAHEFPITYVTHPSSSIALGTSTMYKYDITVVGSESSYPGTSTY